jgi:hypothetical protein
MLLDAIGTTLSFFFYRGSVADIVNIHHPEFGSDTLLERRRQPGCLKDLLVRIIIVGAPFV